MVLTVSKVGKTQNEAKILNFILSQILKFPVRVFQTDLI
jgi:hypothetical protein